MPKPPLDRMQVLAQYTITHTNNDDTVLVRGTDLDGDWIHEWDIFSPAPTLADMCRVAVADYLAREGN